MEDYAVIVDGYHIRDGEDRGFATAFRSRGVLPVCILSTERPIAKFSSRWHPDDFDRVHSFDGDFSALLTLVRSYDPLCIVAGNETGVELTARLAEALMPEKGNVIGSALAQRDKGEMMCALERAGVPTLRTISASDSKIVARWLAESHLEGRPLVVKPPKSGGTDNVRLVEAGRDWKPYFSQLLGAINSHGQRNDRVIVQEYAEGTEYIVDLYSVNGEHGLVDACSYIKHHRGDRIGIYDAVDFLSPVHPDIGLLADYAMRAAHAAGIRNGSTHAEIVLTADGPRLIELAARHSGSCMMISGSIATGDNQIHRTVRHYVDGEFTPGFHLIQPVRTTWLCATDAGPARDIEILEATRDLPTVRKVSLPRNGQPIKATYDASSRLGWIIQAAPDWAAIETDYKRIRELERCWNARQSDEAPARV